MQLINHFHKNRNARPVAYPVAEEHWCGMNLRKTKLKKIRPILGAMYTLKGIFGSQQ